MPTEMQILGWRSEGLRCPDHEVNFQYEENKVFPVTLIQMPNGTGKTTTLMLLRAALSGEAEGKAWDSKKVRSLQKQGSDGDTGRFLVNLVANQRRLTIAMLFNFDEGTVRYTTTMPGSGLRDGFHPSRDVQKFLRPKFVEYFVFDGELAEKLLSHNHANAQVAIDDLFQIELFAAIGGKVGDYWEEKTARKGATEDKGLTQRRNKVKNLKERIAQLTREQSAKQKECVQIEDELKRKHGSIQAALAAQKELGERLARAGADLSDETAQVNNGATVVFEKMQSPHALSAVFAREMIALKRNLDRVKLPESTAREWFEELAEEAECVCGRELDDATRRAIRARASDYLGSDNVAFLNAMKGNIVDEVGATPDQHEQDLRQALDELLEHCRTQEELRTNRDAIQAEGVSTDPTLKRATEDITRFENRLKTLRDELAEYENSDQGAGDERTTGIDVLKSRLKIAERKLAEITETILLRDKRDTLLRVLEQAHKEARISVSAEVCEETNERIAQLMPYNAIRVSAIDQCLVLRDQEGGSVGETLSVAYAFLATLFNRTDHTLPFIVDSPANPIDLAVRAKIGELIPRLTRQFIAFTISSERQGFMPALEITEGKIQYITLFRKGAQDLERAARRESHVEETSDGLCVHGRKFFHEFHIDLEASNNVV
jgi:DNA sulfur modification protein DndD